MGAGGEVNVWLGGGGRAGGGAQRGSCCRAVHSLPRQRALRKLPSQPPHTEKAEQAWPLSHQSLADPVAVRGTEVAGSRTRCGSPREVTGESDNGRKEATLLLLAVAGQVCEVKQPVQKRGFVVADLQSALCCSVRPGPGFACDGSQLGFHQGEPRQVDCGQPSPQCRCLMT